MLKKIFMLVLCTIMLLSCMIIPAMAADEVPEDGTGEEVVIGPALGEGETLNEDGSVTCKYGTITADYADASVYPFAMFVNGIFNQGFQTWGKDSVVTSVLGWTAASTQRSELANKDLTILLRRNYVKAENDKSFTNTHQISFKTMTIDLNGYALDYEDSYFISTSLKNVTSSAVKKAQSANGTTYTVMNGTLAGTAAPFRVVKSGSNVTIGKSLNVTFDNVTFVNSAPLTTAASFVQNASGTITLPDGVETYVATATFKNCKAMTAAGEPTFATVNGITEGHEKVTFNISCKHYDNNEDYVCDFCGKRLVPSYTEVSLTVSESLAINYYTDIPVDEKDEYTFKVSDTVIEPVVKNYNGVDTVVYSYTGIGPHHITSKVKAELYKGDILCDSKVYSVEQYCHEAYALEVAKGDGKNDSLIYLLCGLLTYAQKAEEYRFGRASVVTLPEGMVFEDCYMAYDPIDLYYEAFTGDRYAVASNANDALCIKYAGIWFDSYLRVFFKISAAEAPTGIKLNGTEVEAVLEDGYYVVYTDILTVADYDKAFVLELSNGAKVQYSVYTYAYQMAADAEIGELAIALYNFGACCDEYVKSLAPAA